MEIVSIAKQTYLFSYGPIRSGNIIIDDDLSLHSVWGLNIIDEVINREQGVEGLSSYACVNKSAFKQITASHEEESPLHLNRITVLTQQPGCRHTHLQQHKQRKNTV